MEVVCALLDVDVAGLVPALAVEREELDRAAVELVLPGLPQAAQRQVVEHSLVVTGIVLVPDAEVVEGREARIVVDGIELRDGHVLRLAVAAKEVLDDAGIAVGVEGLEVGVAVGGAVLALARGAARFGVGLGIAGVEVAQYDGHAERGRRERAGMMRLGAADG